MSALCQKRTLRAAERAPLFDHLVGNGEHARRTGETERLGRFEVDHQVELSRLHHWQVGGLLAFENPARKNSSLPGHIGTGNAYKLSEGGTSVTLPAALIATSCPTIAIAMSADLLMSPTDTCKFGGLGLSTSLRNLLSSRTSAVTS